MTNPQFAVMLVTVLAACTPETPPDKAPPLPPAPLTDACGASQMQSLIGRPASDLERMKFATPFRVIKPGMAVTMDYRDDRLNIEIDKRDTIIRVYCG